MSERYDLAFIGHLCFDEDVRADGSRVVNTGGAAVYGAVAAACTGLRVGAVIRVAPGDEGALDVMRERGVHVVTEPAGQTTRVEISHPTGRADERRIVTLAFAGCYTGADALPVEAEHVHLAGCNDHDFTLDYIHRLKREGRRLSLDMQSVVRRNDPATGEMSFTDDPDKRDYVAAADAVKLDILEARLLAGTEDLEAAARVVQGWGCPEVVITSGDGVLARAGSESHFATFSNRTLAGRTGRGDTTFGAYLARRRTHGPAEALQFAAALVSLKMEAPGPFGGTLADVLERMG
jgi:sugar/nucleoside kinase (ribokinase family)